MATNSRNNNNVNVMAEELGIHDNANSSQPSLSFYATGDGGYPSPEQKPKPLKERIKERIKENWEAFKAILKTTKGKFKMAMITLATIAIVALTGTGIAAGVAAGDVNKAVDGANGVINNGAQIAYSIDYNLSEIDPYADYLTLEEQEKVIEVGTNVSNWEQKSEEVKTSLADVQASKNVFSASNIAKNELVPKTNELAGMNLSADSAYVSNLLTAVQARAGQETASNQAIIQSIINGEGTYYNMDKIQDTMNQIDGYFVDADGNGTADIVETVNGIEDTKLNKLANEALASMNGAKASADSTFATLQANWNKFTEYANSGDYATALSYYKTNIDQYASNLAGNLSTVEAKNNNINNYVTQDQNKAVIEKGFIDDEINQFSITSEYQKTGLGEISSVNYKYNPENGVVSVVIRGTEKGSTVNAFKVYNYKAEEGLTVYDAGAVIDALNGTKYKIESQYYTEIGNAINATVSMTANGQTTRVTGNYIKGYSYEREGTNIYKISAVLLGTDNSVVELKVNNLVLGEDEQLTQDKVLELIDDAISKSNIKVNSEIELVVSFVAPDGTEIEME